MRFITGIEYLEARDAYESIMAPVGEAAHIEYKRFEQGARSMIAALGEFEMALFSAGGLSENRVVATGAILEGLQDANTKHATAEGRRGASSYWSGDGIPQA